MDRRLLFVAIGIIVVGAIYSWQFIPSAGDVKGSATVGLTIFYEDGTNETVDPTDNALSTFIPLTIKTTTGSPVSSVKYNIQVKPVFTGEVTSISYDASVITIGVDMKTKTSLGSSGFSGSLTSGAWNTVASGTVTAAQLETWTSTYGVHQLNVGTLVSVKMTFASGDPVTRSADCTAQWKFEKIDDTPATPAGSFTSLNVQVTHTPLS